MSTTKSKLKELRKTLIKFLAKILGENISSRAFDWLLVLLFGGGTLGTIYLFLRDAIWNPTTKLLTTQLKLVEVKLTPILLLLALFYFLLLILFGYRLHKFIFAKNPYGFFIWRGIRFRYNKISGELDGEKYCPDHRIAYIRKTYNNQYVPQFPIILYECPFCGTKHTQKITPKVMGEIYVEAENIALSKARNELKVGSSN